MPNQTNQHKNIATLVAGRTILALVVAYILLNLGIAVQKNVTINHTIAQLREQIAALNLKIHTLNNQIVYFQSDAYRTVEAKRRLGLKRPGERVIFAPENVDSDNNEQSDSGPTHQPAAPSDESGNVFERASHTAKTWSDWFLAAPSNR